jgi:hypothetical protein
MKTNGVAYCGPGMLKRSFSVTYGRWTLQFQQYIASRTRRDNPRVETPHVSAPTATDYMVVNTDLVNGSYELWAPWPPWPPNFTAISRIKILVYTRENGPLRLSTRNAIKVQNQYSLLLVPH